MEVFIKHDLNTGKTCLETDHFNEDYILVMTYIKGAAPALDA